MTEPHASHALPSSQPAPGAEPAPRPSLKALLPLLPYAARYRGRALLALLALSMAAGATLVVPMAVRRMIDYGFSGASAGLINTYFTAMIAVVAVLALASAGRYYLVMTLGERVVADLRADVFAHLTRLDASFYDTARSGELVSRLTADTTQMKSAFGASASIALRNLFMFVGAVAMMVVTSPKLSGFVLVAIPLIVVPLVASGRSVRARSRAAQDRLADATAYAAERLGAVRTMQAFGAEKASAGKFRGATENAYQAARAATSARALLTSVAIFLAFGSVVGVLWFGAQDVLAKRMTGGELSQFVLYAVFGAGALGALSEVWSEISSAAGAASRIAELLAIIPKIAAPAKPEAMPVPARGEIDFAGVSFAYPSAPERLSLKTLSLHVRAGESVAIVGPSGAGKSTLFQLLMRFYDPVSGEIRVDGVRIDAVEPRDLRARLALVPQDPVIFGATISENIAFGHDGATQAEIERAAKQAAADDFIRALPEGYATRVGERGVTLSGGQRQRLAIARAILMDAPVLLLDEATSALDAENEAAVQDALVGLMKGRTTLVIAHRLATVLSCDRILVMEDGRIVEEGDHSSLVAKDGLYARLARLQFEAGAAALADKAAE